MEQQSDDFGNRRRKSGGIVFGLMLVLLGVVLILQNVGLVSSTPRGFWWLTLWGLLSISLGLVEAYSRLARPTVERASGSCSSALASPEPVPGLELSGFVANPPYRDRDWHRLVSTERPRYPGVK